jgi:hypothetical protein
MLGAPMTTIQAVLFGIMVALAPSVLLLPLLWWDEIELSEDKKADLPGGGFSSTEKVKSSGCARFRAFSETLGQHSRCSRIKLDPHFGNLFSGIDLGDFLKPLIRDLMARLERSSF